MDKYSINREKYNVLNTILGDRIEEFLNYLGLKYWAESNYYLLNCPIHQTSDSRSCLVFPSGDKIAGWKCCTKGCHEIHGKTLISFYRAILSVEELGWANEGDEIYPWSATINNVCEFLGVNFKKIKVDEEELDKRLFVRSLSDRTKREKVTNPYELSREQIRNSLVIPSPYYLGRNVPPELLYRYDIGDARNPGRPLTGRSVFPVYDSKGVRSVGFVGRSLSVQCPKCKGYHEEAVPCSVGKSWPKWKNLGNLKDFWYNYWVAKPHIERTKIALIVEGPGDVLSLEAAGIKGGLASFGVDISDSQLISLERLGVFSLILLHDNDSAGQQSKDKLVKKLSNCFHLVCPNLPEGKKDVGEMSPESLRTLISPLIKSIELRYS